MTGLILVLINPSFSLLAVNYARSRPEMMKYAMEGFLAVSFVHLTGLFMSFSTRLPDICLAAQDSNDRNPLIRALAIRTMSYIQVPAVRAYLAKDDSTL